jgi:hypothetical protein
MGTSIIVNYLIAVKFFLYFFEQQIKYQANLP